MLSLVFNEGHSTPGGTDGTGLTAPEPSDEAIRLARMPHRLVPDDTETAGAGRLAGPTLRKAAAGCL
ncbi:hypothetical protein [Streptomyces sp. NPDC097640]|uniref:hypothetical protein n=1 Tax=Streptomyces sp. NPDC097640 TaxID=3157229 RepID=UPI00332FE5A2